MITSAGRNRLPCRVPKNLNIIIESKKRNIIVSHKSEAAQEMRKFTLIERIVYENASVHDCGRFGVVLSCNGESDFLMCAKCGRGWINPCKHKKR